MLFRHKFILVTLSLFRAFAEMLQETPYISSIPHLPWYYNASINSKFFKAFSQKKLRKRLVLPRNLHEMAPVTPGHETPPELGILPPLHSHDAVVLPPEGLPVLLRQGVARNLLPFEGPHPPGKRGEEDQSLLPAKVVDDPGHIGIARRKMLPQQGQYPEVRLQRSVVPLLNLSKPKKPRKEMHFPKHPPLRLPNLLHHRRKEILLHLFSSIGHQGEIAHKKEFRMLSILQPGPIEALSSFEGKLGAKVLPHSGGTGRVRGKFLRISEKTFSISPGRSDDGGKNSTAPGMVKKGEKTFEGAVV